jgi:hypothetical protein
MKPIANQNKALFHSCLTAEGLMQGDNTPLHWAAMRGHVEIVNLLLQRGADRAIRNKQDKLPIDLCQPCWSNAYRYTREVLAA